jgi:hypothetical protein
MKTYYPSVKTLCTIASEESAKQIRKLFFASEEELNDKICQIWPGLQNWLSNRLTL